MNKKQFKFSTCLLTALFVSNIANTNANTANIKTNNSNTLNTINGNLSHQKIVNRQTKTNIRTEHITVVATAIREKEAINIRTSKN